jgi:hypothetical protein
MADEMLLQTIINKIETLDDKYEKILNETHKNGIAIEQIRGELNTFMQSPCPKNKDGIKTVIYKVLSDKGIKGDKEKKNNFMYILVVLNLLVTTGVVLYGFLISIPQ